MVNSEAEFFISDKKIKLEDEEGNYIFWVAFLNSENEENERSIRTMYGYTELLPGQITADTLISSDGNSYMDFLLNKFKIGNKKSSLDWNVSKDEQLSIRNANFEIETENNLLEINPEDATLSVKAKGHEKVYSSWGWIDRSAPSLRFYEFDRESHLRSSQLLLDVFSFVPNSKVTCTLGNLSTKDFGSTQAGLHLRQINDLALPETYNNSILIDVSQELLYVIMRNLPTDDQLLEPGQLWRNGNDLKIK